MPIFPLGGLYASLGLAMRYWVDKHALLRRWARQPDMGSSMVDNSNTQLLICLLAALLTCQRYYASWPFDNQCPDGPGSYRVCDRWQGRVLFQHEDYMSRDQKNVVSIFTLVFTVVASALGGYYTIFTSYYSVKSCFCVSSLSCKNVAPILLLSALFCSLISLYLPFRLHF
jgi:hypothetical protein